MKWEPEGFQLEKSSVWSFPERGDWATHDSKYRGNCSPYVIRNLILRYSIEGDRILDQFAGGGTSLIEAKLLNRMIVMPWRRMSRMRSSVDIDNWRLASSMRCTSARCRLASALRASMCWRYSESACVRVWRLAH